MSSKESIFEEYPQDISRVVGFESGSAVHKVFTVISKVYDFFAIEDVPYFEVPGNHRSPEYQLSIDAKEKRDQLDAIMGRRINRIGQGIGIAALSFAPEFVQGIDSPVASSVPGIIAFTAMAVVGGLRAGSVGRIDSVYQVHQLESNVRRPDNFIRLLFSKKWYEGARSRQESKREQKLQTKISDQELSE